MSREPEALRLADALDDEFTQGRISNYNGRKAAAELRRLHALNQDLLEALQFCAGTSYITDAHEIAEDAIVKATGEKA